MTLATRNITNLFATEPGRLEQLSGEVAGIYFDFSKSLISAAELGDLVERAMSGGFEDKRRTLFSGGVLNASEGRAVTHLAERGSGSGPALRQAKSNHQRSMQFVEQILRGEQGEIGHVIHLGIGGSALGPALLLEALSHLCRVDTHIVSNIDGFALQAVLSRCDPHKTLVLVASKTFTTIETLTNARSVAAWMLNAGVHAPLSRFVAITAAPSNAERFGLKAEQILAFPESVGGRYSIWSSIGATLAIGTSWQTFCDLLDGAAEMDRHFMESNNARNLPLLAAAIDVHNVEVLGAASRAVFAYDQRLRLLPDYLQQLEMESNGKSVSWDGAPLKGASAPVTWGGVGTDVQHAVMQLLHQGRLFVPVEFVAVVNAGHQLAEQHHVQLLCNCIAQGAALMRGRPFDDALRKSDGDMRLAAARATPGNRPSMTVLLERLDARSLGALLAFYEHRTFAASILYQVNAFDQWGVELGKEIASALATEGIDDADPSTIELLRRIGRYGCMQGEAQ